MPNFLTKIIEFGNMWNMGNKGNNGNKGSNGSNGSNGSVSVFHTITTNYHQLQPITIINKNAPLH